MHVPSPHLEWKILGQWICNHVTLADVNRLNELMYDSILENCSTPDQPCAMHGTKGVERCKERTVRVSTSVSKLAWLWTLKYMQLPPGRPSDAMISSNQCAVCGCISWLMNFWGCGTLFSLASSPPPGQPNVFPSTEEYNAAARNKTQI